MIKYREKKKGNIRGKKGETRVFPVSMRWPQYIIDAVHRKTKRTGKSKEEVVQRAICKGL